MVSTKDTLNNAKPTTQEPVPLENKVPEVMKLTPEMLPENISAFTFDVAERSQCPPEYVAVAALVTLSSLIGGKYALYPKQNDTWQICPNLWGAIIGPPSAMKSPAIKEVLHIVSDIEKADAERCKEIVKREKDLQKLQKAASKEKEKVATKLYEEGQVEEALKAMSEAEPEESTTSIPRLIINDATIEKLGEILEDNPNGLLLYRDELSGWLNKLSREDAQQDRAFYLECFDGFGRFTCDRIGRGTTVIERCILSILGSIQPSKIQGIIHDAMSGKIDDGLIQRLQLAVWPDVKKGKKWKDQSPNACALEAFIQLINKFHQLPSLDDGYHEMRFTPEAQSLFTEWWEKLQAQIDDDHVHPVIQSHLGKYPKTAGSFALIFQLCTDNHDAVGYESMKLSIKWCDFLHSHALRMYSAFDTAKMASAKLLLDRKEKLPVTFTVRDIRRKGWVGLKDNNNIMEAINILIDHYHLIEIDIKSGGNGGRPTTGYRWNTVQKKTAKVANMVPPKTAKTKS